jgi:hypothetical protein
MGLTRRGSQRRSGVTLALGHRWPGVAALFVRPLDNMSHETRVQSNRRPVLAGYNLDRIISLLVVARGLDRITWRSQPTDSNDCRWFGSAC